MLNVFKKISFSFRILSNLEQLKSIIAVWTFKTYCCKAVSWKTLELYRTDSKGTHQNKSSSLLASFPVMLIIKQHFVVQPNVFVWLWCSCGIATTIPRQKNVLNSLNQSQRDAGKKQIHKLARVQDTEALRWATDSLAGQHYFCFFHTFLFASVSCFDCLLLLYL